MPELQYNLFSSPFPPMPDPLLEIRCDRCHYVKALNHTSVGNYCNTCFDRVFTHCSNCHCCILIQEATPNDSGKIYCRNCYSAKYSQCSVCSREVAREHRLFSPGGDIICQNCFNRRYYICDGCGQPDRRVHRQQTPDDANYCESCFEDNCISCRNCGHIVWIDDAHYDGDYPYCSECHRPSREWDMGEFTVTNPTYDVIGSQRKYGVELETCSCPDHTQLRENTIWECKTDCSIEGMEFVSPIMYGDEGLTEIKDFCQLANHREFQTSRSCGFHAHFDVNSESSDSLRSIAYAYRRTYELWCCFVPNSRSENRYCGSPDYECSDIANENDFDYFVGKRDRFEFVNWRSYIVHGSLEVRMYQGTLDAEEICNWVMLHARFIDAVSQMSIEEIDAKFKCSLHIAFAWLTQIIGSELADYWAEKARFYHKRVRPVERPNLQPPASNIHPNRIFQESLILPELGERII